VYFKVRNVGTVVRGIRTPIIKKDDDLESIVIESIMKTKEDENIEFRDKDVIAITEAVVSIADGNYASVDDIATDINNKCSAKHMGLVFPTPLSRNRFTPFLKGIARGLDKMTILMSYPSDEVGNSLFDEELLEKYNINPYSDILDEETYMSYFGEIKHIFTGVNYVSYFKEVVENENCAVEFVFANNPKVILDYAKDVLVCTVHSRERVKKQLEINGATTVLGLDNLMNASINGSGFNVKYGLLGSNRATDETLKLFPNDKQGLVDSIQKKMFDLTGKNIEVMIYGDGAFKDPIGGIWELADPVVSPYYTSGLEGTPNEIKIKYISDNKLSNLRDEELIEAMKKEILNKQEDLVGSMASQGTTPRRLTDLIGSLCDLTSGSGDKGTPVVFIQGYFDNYAD